MVSTPTGRRDGMETMERLKKRALWQERAAMRNAASDPSEDRCGRVSPLRPQKTGRRQNCYVSLSTAGDHHDRIMWGEPVGHQPRIIKSLLVAVFGADTSPWGNEAGDEGERPLHRPFKPKYRHMRFIQNNSESQKRHPSFPKGVCCSFFINDSEEPATSPGATPLSVSPHDSSRIYPEANPH